MTIINKLALIIAGTGFSISAMAANNEIAFTISNNITGNFQGIYTVSFLDLDTSRVSCNANDCYHIAPGQSINYKINDKDGFVNSNMFFESPTVTIQEKNVCQSRWLLFGFRGIANTNCPIGGHCNHSTMVNDQHCTV